MANVAEEEKHDDVYCDEIIRCRQGREVVEYQVNLTSNSRDWKEVWVPGDILPQHSLRAFLRKLRSKNPEHWIFERPKNGADDIRRQHKSELLRLYADVNPVEKVLGFLVDDQDPTKLRPRMHSQELDRKLADLTTVSNAAACELLAEVIDSKYDLRGRYDRSAPVLSERERLDLQEQLNANSISKKMIVLSSNIKREDAKSLYGVRYTDEIEFDPSVDIDVDDLLRQARGCTCTGDVCQSGNCEHYKAYDEEGRLKEKYLFNPFRHSVHECNSKCKCGPSCPNRLVQRGSAVQKEVFSTNEMGLGVRANEFVKVGTFLGTYAGRLKKNSPSEAGDGGRYAYHVFVTSSDDPCVTVRSVHPYQIDACKEGNLTRLVNHSCKANVVVVAVHTKYSHPSIHELALFAVRDIRQGEELYLHYSAAYFQDFQCRCPEKYAIPHKPFLGSLDNYIGKTAFGILPMRVCDDDESLVELNCSLKTSPKI